MAKTKKRDQDLFDTLRASGLRKRVAGLLSDGSKQARRGDVPKQARRALDNLRGVLADLEDRAPIGKSSRSQAAKKAARTRKLKAAKRSASARKGAKTRARNS